MKYIVITVTQINATLCAGDGFMSRCFGDGHRGPLRQFEQYMLELGSCTKYRIICTTGMSFIVHDVDHHKYI